MNDCKIYIYPYIPIEKRGSHNPYIDNLIDSLSSHFKIVNKDCYNTTGILDLFKFFFRANCFCFNWIEDIGTRRFGTIQTIVALFFFLLAKIAKKKLIWTIHNPVSHSGFSFGNHLITNYLSRYSDVVICHSEESVIDLKMKGFKGNIFYFFHPFPNSIQPFPLAKKEIDILIWGTMYPYKGVLEFLENISEELNQFNVYIVGHFPEKSYFNKIKRFQNDRIRVEDRFISKDELIDLHAKTNFVLFPYTGNSVLNSGALIDSLMFGAKIIGPSKGAFKELAKLSVIFNFENYSDIPQIIIDNRFEHLNSNLNNFYIENSWSNFGCKLYMFLKSCNFL